MNSRRRSSKSIAHEPTSIGFVRRAHFLTTIFSLVAVVIAGRFIYLQIFERERFVALAEEQHVMSQSLLAERGEIALRDGDGIYPAAVNREYKLAYVVPKLIDDPVAVALAVSTILGLDEAGVRARLLDRHDPFEILKKRISDEEERRLKELNLKGVAFLPEIYRYYPAESLASKTLGFVGPGDAGEIGIYGVEASWNSELAGQNGHVSQERDAAGRWIALTDRDHVEPKDGESIVLTLDRVVQYEVEKILRESMDLYRAESASALVMEPKTGKIIAMATLPDFNPNEYGKTEDLSRFMNQAISIPYEPGSIMKPITMALGIDAGKVAPTTEYVDTGSVSEAGYTIKNAEGKVYGRSSMTKVLEESINTGMIFIERLLGNEGFRDGLKRFGFGTKTGVRLPAEQGGSLRNLDNLKGSLQFYTASFGQGITATPLQLAAAYGALANGGVLMQPQIVDRIIHADGTTEPVVPREVRRVVSQATSKEVGAMLRSVVVNGHGKRADVPGYLVVGKTGTAQVAKKGEKGYEDGLTIGSFAGYAPLDDPQFVVLVKFDNPQDVLWAESSAAPTFGKIMQFLLNYQRIQPTEPLSKKSNI
ncbi:MAG: penicillin-binding protein 2 [Candidatus Moraniibacteriota bacterium]|nr:MAG: penicillin-binding protein 2 [Candidatus Moranbacteria bacterium]